MITRRRSLSIVAGAAATPLLADVLVAQAAAAAPAAAATPARTGKGFDPLADALLTHVRIRGHQDGRRVFFVYHGTFYAQVTAQRTVPMFHIEGASSARMLRQPDGSFAYQLREAGWFCDLQSREVVTEAANPLHGRLVKPKHYASGQRTRFTADARVMPADTLPPGIEYVGYIGRPTADQDVVWTTEELLVRSPGAPPANKVRVQTSLATFSANRADLERSPDAFVPCRLNYQTLGSFLPWMDMGDASGVITWRLAGRKTDQLDELPPALRSRIEREHPDVLTV